MPFGRRGRKRVERTDVDGVPCFFGDAPPPFAATLLFRVGRVDESLRMSGVTHLAEHLVMPAEPPRDYERNARVEAVFSVFWAAGRQDEVLDFLTDTCALIREPPLHRLETERQILQTEAAGRPSGPIEGTMALRYGAAGAGLVGYDEFGLAWIGQEEVGAWIGEHLTAENAACWMTGRPPSDFRLSLPAGERIEPPAPAPIADLKTPAYFAHGAPGQVIVAMQGQRSTALVSAFDTLRDRTWRTLRYERGLAYEIGDWYEPLTSDDASAILWVDSLERNAPAAAEGLLAILDDLAANGPTAEELEDHVRGARRGLDDPLGVPGELHFTACEALLGRESSFEELVREKELITPEDAAAALSAARETLLVVVPQEVPPPAGMQAYPLTATSGVTGRRFSAKGLSRQARSTAMIVGDEGVSAESPDGELSTVRFADCEAVLHWPDGSRTLHGRDGFRVHVDPTAWRKGKEAVAAIDERVDPQLVVVMERELTERLSSIDTLVAEKLKRRWVVSDELKTLPGMLGDGERVLTLAEANRGLRAGLLVVTDQRVLWLYAPKTERMLEAPRHEVGSVRVREGSRLRDAKLWIEIRGEVVSFSDIVPRERAPEVRDLLAPDQPAG